MPHHDRVVKCIHIIILKHLTLIIMKRTKSVLSMRNLAASIKQSIQLDANKLTPFQPLKTTKSLANFMPRYSHTNSQDAAINQQRKENRIFVLEKQITSIEKQLKNGSSMKNYNSDLSSYDEISKIIQQTDHAINIKKFALQQARNQIMMLQQQIHSSQFNIQERMAQKEYHEEFIEAYGHQYQAESKLVFNIIDLQLKNHNIKQNIKSIDESTQKASINLQEWKKEIDYDLNQHKLKNSIKMIRMKLIGFEDQCDAFCLNNNLRKLRELYCLFFKNYAKMNGIGTDQVQQGIDIYICKNGLCEQFSEFIRQRLIYNKPKCSLLEEYLSTLASMQQIYRKSIFEANRKLHALLYSDIKHLQKEKNAKIKEIEMNQERIKQLNQQIDDQFNNDSLAIIEYMRQKNRNKYDLKEIKAKLRQNKKEQRNRISKIRESFLTMRYIEGILQKSNVQQITERNKDQMEQFTQTLIQIELHIQQLQKKYAKQLKEKQIIQDRISSEITKWRQVDQKKNKLKSLYEQLQSAKKYEIDLEEEKPSYKITKNHKLSIDQKRTTLDDKLTKCDPSQATKSINYHSKNTSISSLNQSKSVLSLSNPFKKMLQKSVKQHYQPIITNCQMILSRKLTHKELQINDLESRSSNILKEKNRDMMKKNKNIVRMQENNDENNIWNPKNKSLTMTPFKQIPTTTLNPKGKVSMSQRQSLSKLLISKFNR